MIQSIVLVKGSIEVPFYDTVLHKLEKDKDLSPLLKLVSVEITDFPFIILNEEGRDSSFYRIDQIERVIKKIKRSDDESESFSRPDEEDESLEIFGKNRSIVDDESLDIGSLFNGERSPKNCESIKDDESKNCKSIKSTECKSSEEIFERMDRLESILKSILNKQDLLTKGMKKEKRKRRTTDKWDASWSEDRFPIQS